ncbi:AfsR/SARP family transcriptional regulator, partial [Actinokineospora sp.]|uniref:AfsR/SARP family transcriptional regulator n=1 Tax=Actinokineospora sp. TaxID=1872133 RepID=UPI003D6A0574
MDHVDLAEVRLLGPLEVSGPGGALRLPGPRPRALLALLALRAPEALSRSHLIDALWGPTPPPTAVRTMTSHLTRIRQALVGIGLGGLLVTVRPGYALRLRPGCLDTARFDEQVRAGRRALGD